MLDNKMTLTKIEVRKIRKNIALFLAVFIVLALAASSVALAAGKVKAGGVLRSIETDGVVIIDKMGYLVSPSATVQDSERRSISLKDISLPHHVYFEYEYAPGGFMIILIRETGG